jgi:hypothetical protein
MWRGLLCGSSHRLGGFSSPTLQRIRSGVTLLDADMGMSNQMSDFAVINHVNKLTRKAPFLRVSESLRVNISCH